MFFSKRNKTNKTLKNPELTYLLHAFTSGYTVGGAK